MDHMSSLVKNKRRQEGGSEQCDRQPKRVCSGLGSCIQVGCDILMDVWETPQNGTPKHHVVSMVLGAQDSNGLQRCSRCMAGEPLLKYGLGKDLVTYPAQNSTMKLCGQGLAYRASKGHINHIMQRY